MEKLLAEIENLKKTDIKKKIDSRISEFTQFKSKTSQEIFKELCFCLLTANYSAEGGIKIQKEISDGFLDLTEQDLAKKLKSLGHRFPNARAKYIIESRKYKDSINEILNSLKGEELRDYLVKSIKGIGYKESSHFLRNIGYSDYAIIDFHILDVLEKNQIIKKPKTLTKKIYIEIESKLKELAEKSNLNLGELDLYLWYLETGKILK